MKVGLFTDTYYPQFNGVATSVLMLKENLVSQDHQVYVFTTTDPDALQDEVNVYRIPSIPFTSARWLGMASTAIASATKPNFIRLWTASYRTI